MSKLLGSLARSHRTLMRLHPSITTYRVLLVALATLALLLLLMLLFVASPYPHSRGVVFWEDDTEAAAAPYQYRFSTTFQSVYRYPTVMVSERKEPCLPTGTATVRFGGRLGNLILEYASLWTAARLYNLSAFVPREISDRLEEVFEPMDMPTTEEFVAHWTCPEDLNDSGDHLRDVDQETTPLSAVVSDAQRHQRLIVFDACTVLVETIVPLAGAIRHHLRYLPELRNYAQETLRTIRQAVLTEDPSIKEVVFAGVHVRRTDYQLHLQHLYNTRQPADERYFGKAALWLQDRVVAPGSKLVLVVASDDPDWVNSVLLPHLHYLGLHHTYMAGNGELMIPEYDMALLSHCNHSVLAYGTFGLWTALSAGGRTVVYHLDNGGAMSPAMQFAKHMLSWVAIR